MTQEMNQTIDKFAAQLILAKETYEGEQATTEERSDIYEACAAIVRKFAGMQAKDRNYFNYTWNSTFNGREYGFSYLSHYICQLFIELATKRYDPKTKKDMSYVMRTAHEFKRNGKDLSAAMTKAYTVVERSGKLRTDSIQQECVDISTTCLLGKWNTIMPNYPALNRGVNGEADKARPKAAAVVIIADILGPLCTMIGYK